MKSRVVLFLGKVVVLLVGLFILVFHYFEDPFKNRGADCWVVDGLIVIVTILLFSTLKPKKQ